MKLSVKIHCWGMMDGRADTRKQSDLGNEQQIADVEVKYQIIRRKNRFFSRNFLSLSVIRARVLLSRDIKMFLSLV